MAAQCFWVALGGALGAVSRYLCGMLPFLQRGVFPLPTLLINLAGAFLIGLIAQVAAQRGAQSSSAVLFLKVGLCGGFTTFSTFSLETVTLLSDGKSGLAAAYVALSGLVSVGCGAGAVAGAKTGITAKGAYQ